MSKIENSLKTSSEPRKTLSDETTSQKDFKSLPDFGPATVAKLPHLSVGDSTEQLQSVTVVSSCSTVGDKARKKGKRRRENGNARDERKNRSKVTNDIFAETFRDKELAVELQTRLYSFSSTAKFDKAKTDLLDTEKGQSVSSAKVSPSFGRKKTSKLDKRLKRSLNVKKIDFESNSRNNKYRSKDKLYTRNRIFEDITTGIKVSLSKHSKASMNECFFAANGGAVIGRPSHRHQQARCRKKSPTKYSGDAVNHGNSSNNNNCVTGSKKTPANKSEDAANHSVIMVNAPPHIQIGKTSYKKSAKSNGRDRTTRKNRHHKENSNKNPRRVIKEVRNEDMQKGYEKQKSLEEDNTMSSNKFNFKSDRKLTSSDEGFPRSSPKLKKPHGYSPVKEKKNKKRTVTKDKRLDKINASTNIDKINKETARKWNDYHSGDVKPIAEKSHPVIKEEKKVTKKNTAWQPTKENNFKMTKIFAELESNAKNRAKASKADPVYFATATHQPKEPSAHNKWLQVGSYENSCPSASTSSSNISSEATSHSSYQSYTCVTNSEGSECSAANKDWKPRLKQAALRSDSDQEDTALKNQKYKSKSTNLQTNRRLASTENKRMSRFNKKPKDAQKGIHRLGPRKERPSRMSAKAEDEECHSKWQHHQLVVVSRKPGDRDAVADSNANEGRKMVVPPTKLEKKRFVGKSRNRNVQTRKDGSRMTIRDLYSLHNVLSDTQNGTVGSVIFFYILDLKI